MWHRAASVDQCHAMRLLLGLSLSKRFVEQLGYEIVKEEEQLRPDSLRRRIRLLGFGGTITSAASCHATATYASPGFIVAAVFSPSRGIETELN